jgi:hypothetical protein
MAQTVIHLFDVMQETRPLSNAEFNIRSKLKGDCSAGQFSNVLASANVRMLEISVKGTPTLGSST